MLYKAPEPKFQVRIVQFSFMFFISANEEYRKTNGMKERDKNMENEKL